MARVKQLKDLLAATEFHELHGTADIPVTGISYDSREDTKGTLFACWQGENHDGNRYVPEAVEGGAEAVLVERRHPDVDVPQIIVTDARRAMARLAAAFYDYPSDALTVVGVTGTNGKTTTTFLTKGVLQALGFRTGLMGTIETRIGDLRLPLERTTPEAPDLQRMLARMRDAGCSHVVMEVSSHALDRNRVVGCSFDVGVFTNLTQDHLDYHGTLEAYYTAKERLIRELKPGASPQGPDRAAVINADDAYGERMAGAATVPVWWYTRCSRGSGASWLQAVDIQVTPDGNRFTLRSGSGEVRVRQGLAGPYNVENALAAAAVGRVLGGKLEDVARGIAAVRQVPGRFEAVDEGQAFSVIVDYAHTPDGLANLLAAARQTASGRLITVFGCGGDRDPGKRPQMGRIAVERSDHVVVTSDNPRGEDPQAIIEAVLVGVRQGRAEHSDTGIDVLPDRAEAIAWAIGLAQRGDMVVIAGKGHETYQIFADKIIDFDDREVARSILRQDCAG